MSARYAIGKRAWGHCQRCGFRYYLRELRYDGQQPHLQVCEDCWDPKHPQEYLPDVFDPVTLLAPTGDTEKSVANLQVIDYPPFLGSETVLMPIQIGIGLRSSVAQLVAVDLDPEVGLITTMSLLGLPGVP
jgi:hypothetical protein